MNEQQKGVAYALACFGTWGLFPVFWYPLNHSQMPATQILAWRIVFSAVFAAILLIAFKQGKHLVDAFRRPKLLVAFLLSSVLIAANWLIYLWAITHHHVVDASLGYFINPLFNVLLGFLIFREKLAKAQWIALGLAALGIIWLSVLAHQVPIIGLMLAVSFGFYAVIRKIAPMSPLAGLTLETWLLLPIAAAFLAYCEINGTLIFSNLDGLQKTVLATSGIATTLPLIAFAAGAKRISLSLLGILQNVSPTAQLFLGLAFGEVMTGERLVGYSLVWLGVLVFLGSAWRQR